MLESKDKFAIELLKPGLDTVIKGYLGLMNEFDNEELVDAFENIMTIFATDIVPYAVEIQHHLHHQYMRCQQQFADDARTSDATMTAIAAFNSMRRILDVSKNDPGLVLQLEKIMYPCLVHGLTEAGIDSLEEGIDCVTMILHHGYKEQPISEDMWKLYP